MSTTEERLRERVGAAGFEASRFRDNVRFDIPPESLQAALGFLKGECGFDMLAELTAADLLEYPDARNRFRVLYVLVNTATGERINLRTHVDDPEPTLPSAVPLWQGANWMEREVFDMFGIRFAGHPNLKRILMPDEFAAFPLRKDYPLRGRGERHNFPVITRAES
ncbi:MAG TPA: NADH-quinone oxidoreductase subunit C [Planctomycetaceae bacterium]|jgi:NADH-quinone oxidoreductase subunit C|nr:NADH-quinone oxidoreductase subunit C [Planctomycetaceae bacterium]